MQLPQPCAPSRPVDSEAEPAHAALAPLAAPTKSTASACRFCPWLSPAETPTPRPSRSAPDLACTRHYRRISLTRSAAGALLLQRRKRTCDHRDDRRAERRLEPLAVVSVELRHGPAVVREAVHTFFPVNSNNRLPLRLRLPIAPVTIILLQIHERPHQVARALLLA